MERNDLDGRLEAAQAAVLDRLAPGTRARRVRWSRGETRVLELGDGPPLVLVHGFMDNAALWAPILGALAARHRVIAVDLPGHGLADPFDYADGRPPGRRREPSSARSSTRWSSSPPPSSAPRSGASSARSSRWTSRPG